jgi:hypothetical protein
LSFAVVSWQRSAAYRKGCVMFRVPGKQVLAAKAGYVAACVAAALVLVTSGIAYGVESKLGSIGGSDALSGGPQTGAMNILLMGLESRTDYQGNVLSSTRIRRPGPRDD